MKIACLDEFGVHKLQNKIYSIFVVAAMAGNIIPAIATTNAIVAGVVVLHTLKVLQNQLEECQSVYLRLRPNPRGLIIVPECQLEPPNPKCYVCSHKPTVSEETALVKCKSVSTLERETFCELKVKCNCCI